MTTCHQRLALLALALWIHGAIATAQDAPSLAMSREEAIASALQNNPDLSAAALEIERARSRLRWAGRLANPELELSGSTDQFGSDDGEGAFEIAFSQRFPVTSRLRDEKAVDEQAVELAGIEFRVRQRQLAHEVDKAAVVLLAAERRAQLQGELIGLNRELVTFMTERAGLGELSMLDVTQASLNGLLLEQELGAAQAAVTGARSRLQQLMGVAPERSATLDDTLVLPVETPATTFDLNAVLENRPDYAVLLASDTLNRARLRLAISRRWDDIAFKVFAARELARDAPEGLERNTLAGIGISIPLPFRNHNGQAIEEATSDIEKVRRERDAKVFEIRSEVQAALKARAAAHQLASDAGGGALALARKNFDDFKAAQQAGQASLLQVQQAQGQLLQLQSAALEFQKNYHLSEAALRFLTGSYPIPQEASYNHPQGRELQR